MKISPTSAIYDNPLPQLRSRQAVFPSVCQLKNGTLVSVFSICEAFESVDKASHISFSYDNGETWSEPKKLFDRDGEPFSECSKVTALEDGKLVVIGYAFPRPNPDLPLSNAQTGGLLDDYVFYSISEDEGKTWSKMTKIDCEFSPHIEASAPITVLKDGTWITPVTCFPDWDGVLHSELCGRALRSEDNGKTWSDDSICMNFPGRNVHCYEQRMCQLESGAIICIAWNEDSDAGCRLENHYTVSYDNGKTWSEPQSTGVLGQASSVCAIGGEKFFAIHAIRRDTDRPGVYGYVVDFSEKEWNVVDYALIWEPVTPVMKDTKMAEIFSFLKFGQPSALLLDDGRLMTFHWMAENGQYKVVSTMVEL